MSRRINRDDIDKFHEFGIHIPTRTISLDSVSNDGGEDQGVNYVMAQRFLKNIHILETASGDPITINLDTIGGDLWDGMAIYDAIKMSRCHITMIVRGQASSMGSIILQAADDRVVMPHSHVMFHLGPAGSKEGNIYEVVNAAIYERDYSETLDNIVFAKVTAKTGMNRRKFNDMNFKGRFITAQEAVDLGLADRVMGVE